MCVKFLSCVPGNVTGKSAFGAMDPDRVAKITKMMKDRGAKQADVDGVLDSFEQMRLGWAHMFSRLGYSMKDADPKVLEEFKGIIGPWADKLYAVLPIGVETSIPSQTSSLSLSLSSIEIFK